ncbi:MAG: NAD(P)-binding domain-containing protein [Pseudomonadota bacterium]
MTDKYCVAGCGRMGLPMALAMQRAGLDVMGFDVKPAHEFGSFSASMVTDPAAVSACTVLFSVVRDQKETEDLLFDRQALLLRAARPTLLVICSTLSPRYVTALATRLPDMTHLVDAPMSGAPVAAEERRLSFMLGGDPGDIDRIRPALDAMGTAFHHMGGHGTGMTAKVLNNYLAALSTIGVRQALDWADQLDVDEEALLAVMNDSSGQTWFGSNFDRIEFARHGYASDNTIAILEKDLRALLDALAPAVHGALPEAAINALRRLSPRPAQNRHETDS